MRFKFSAMLAIAFCTLCSGAGQTAEMTASGIVYETAVEFDSESAARAAQLEFLPLPEGKQVAFSTRWDDTNPKHLRMAELLTKYGFRGTFYLTGFNQEFCPKLISDGHSIGNHTLNHRDLTALVPNEIARQILQNRVELESQSNREVNAFVLPYCRFWRSDNPLSSNWIGEALRRSGELGGPEYYQDLDKKYGMQPNNWFGSLLFTVNDRNPDANRFDREVEKRLKLLETRQFIHMTLGIHTWQDEKGFATLARCFEKYGNRPQWWYCNENEYLSYRFVYHNTTVLKKEVEGSKAIFTLRQASPASTGAYVPLWAKVIPAAKDGKKIIALNNPDLRPKKIEAIRTTGNQMSSAKKFPGFSAGFVYDSEKQLLRLKLVNHTGKTIAPISATYRLPLLFGDFQGGYRIPLGPLKNGASLDSELILSRGIQKSPIYHSGSLFFAAEINFKISGESQRLWVCTSYEFPKNKEAVPRDQAMGYGPFAAGSFGSIKAEWKPMLNLPVLLPAFVKIPRSAKEEYAVRLNVIAKHKGDYPFHINRKNVKAFYLNGQKLTLPLPLRLPLKQGKNEVIAVVTANGEESVFAFSQNGKLEQMLVCE